MSGSTREFRNTVLAVFAFALAVRLIALWAASGAVLVEDEVAYTVRAEALLDGDGYVGSYQSWVRHSGRRVMDLPQYPGSYQAPGYPTFIAGVMAVSGRSLLAVQLVQCVLSAASCVLLVLLGRAWFGERAGQIAGWMSALYPNLIAYSHLLWSETLLIFELLLVLWLLLGGEAGQLPSRRRAALGGFVLGVAALTRGTLIYFAPVLLVWMWLLADGPSGLPRRPLRSLGPALGRGAIAIGVALATIAPWSIRSTLLHDGFVLIDTNANYNLWRGNAQGALLAHTVPGVPRYGGPFEAWPLRPVASLDGRTLIERFREAHPDAEPSDLAIAGYAGREARRALWADPGRAARHALVKLGDMWNPTSFLLRHFELGAYGPVATPARIVISTAAVVGYVAVCLLAAFGVAISTADRRTWLILLFVLYLSAGSALAFGLTRFRLPLMPLLMLLAALPLSRRTP